MTYHQKGRNSMKIIRVETNLFDEFKAELLVDDETTSEQLEKAHELFDEYVEKKIIEREENDQFDEEIDYGELLMWAFHDSGVKYEYVPYDAWYVW